MLIVRIVHRLISSNIAEELEIAAKQMKWKIQSLVEIRLDRCKIRWQQGLSVKQRCAVYCVREKLIANTLFRMMQEYLSKKTPNLTITRQHGVELVRQILNPVFTTAQLGGFKDIVLI